MSILLKIHPGLLGRMELLETEMISNPGTAPTGVTVAPLSSSVEVIIAQGPRDPRWE